MLNHLFLSSPTHYTVLVDLSLFLRYTNDVIQIGKSINRPDYTNLKPNRDKSYSTAKFVRLFSFATNNYFLDSAVKTRRTNDDKLSPLSSAIASSFCFKSFGIITLSRVKSLIKSTSFHCLYLTIIILSHVHNKYNS